MIRAKSFPGWQDFGAMLTHLKFIREHHQRIGKVAVVADGAVANSMPHIAGHFVHAEVRHFNFARADAACDWLRKTGSA